MEQRTYSYDAFISYARHDGKIDYRVEALVNILKEKVMGLGTPRFNVFLDVEGIPYGEAFNCVILQAIKESQILVPIVTESYLRSKYCSLEFDEFRKWLKDDHKRKIVNKAVIRIAPPITKRQTRQLYSSAMPGIEISEIPETQILATRGW